MKLIKAWELIFDQIDWFKMMQKTKEKENLDIYRDIFKTIVHFYIEKILKQKKYEKNMKIELNKRDNENINIENENNNNEKNNENDFWYFENNIFLKNDESECESENYINNEIDNKKNNDDENQINDNFEMIDDWVSI